jgi:Rhs element Vgr protein
MAVSPAENDVGAVKVVVKVDGQELAAAVSLVSVQIQRAVNRIPTARLEFTDGDMPRQEFPISDSDDLKPGAKVSIAAGYLDGTETLFEGVVMRQRVHVAGSNDARLTVECSDVAVKMTVGRRNANYIDKNDADILSALVERHGLTATVDSATVVYTELAQHYCSDWDFLLSRADANGWLVAVKDGALTIQRPKASGSPALTVTYGKDLMEFDGDLDARHQYSSAQAFAWDIKAQDIVEGTAADPAGLPAQGNLDSSSLAEVVGLDLLRLQAGAPQVQAGLTRWAEAQQLKSGLARLRGRVRFQGHALAEVGGLIELVGVGSRFSGPVLVTGVRHDISDGNWLTDVEFGLAPDWFTERTDVVAPPAAGLLPAVHGLQVGVVTKLDADPAGEHRVQVKVPVLQAEQEGVWARLMQFHASNGFGAFFLPEVGDEVVLGYFAGDPSHPVVLGSLYSSSRTPPYTLEAKNDTKAWVTRCLARIEINDADKVITITTPGKNQMVLSDKDKSITLLDQNQNKVALTTSGIELNSPKDIVLKATGSIKLDATGPVKIQSQADVQQSGMNVQCEAQIGFTAKGNASAELSASGQTVVKGGLVMIN